MRYSRSASNAGLSPPTSAGPSSASMHHTPSAPPLVRKRTLQDAMPPAYDADLSGDSSSPHSSLPSFEFDPVHSTSPAYSVSTLDSSPMAYSHSASSYGDSASEYDMEGTSGDYLGTRNMGRPELKRRRTAPDVMASPSTPTRWEQESPTDKRGNGKDGQDVWPADVETAFHTALRIIPKLGRKKVMVGGKPCGRNELIADYIRRNTGKIRSRKQVSSHIQVLKNMRKGDEEFMNLVSEPLEGDDTFAPGAALAFFGLPDPNQSPPHRSVAGLQQAESLLSPYRSSFLQRSNSSSSSLSESFIPHSPAPLSAPMSATSSLTNAMKDMHFPIPPAGDRHRTTCPIAPVAFCLWADDTLSDAMHVFTELEPRRGAAGPSSTVYLEDLSSAEREFPGLNDMFDHLPCQFLHARLNLNVPTTREGAASAPQLHTSLKLTSLQDFNLTCVTRIFSFGHEVLSLSEELDRPNRITPSARMATSSANSSPASGPDSPLTPGSSVTGSPSVNPLRHKYSYNAPFASDFWSIFLRGSFSSEGGKMLPDFSKVGEERAAFVMAISGMSVIQEFVVRSEEPTTPLVNGKDISAGSALGDVVLVVTYDFECSDDPTSGTANVSFLTAHKPPPAPSAVSRLRSDSLTVPVPALPMSSPTRAPQGHRRNLSLTKPNLSLHIPPPAQYNVVACSTPGAGPLTPWPQVMHTPSVPPPVHDASESAMEQERLGKIWARDSNDWELNSPALLGNFPGSHMATSSSSSGSSRLPNGSQAMADLTSKAIVAGTPTFSQFPPHAIQHAPTHFGTPFIHPSHNYTVKDEVETDSVETPPSAPMEEMIRVKAEEVEEEVTSATEGVKKIDIQDYFSSILGGTPSKYTVKTES